MKKIALISTFCNNDRKIKVLLESCRVLKNLGVDVMINSPLFLDSSVTKNFDFYFQTKENPILTWPERSLSWWKITPTHKGWLEMARGMKDYGWAALYQMKKLSQIASEFDYDIYYHMNYDVLMDEGFIAEINSNKKNQIYPVKDRKSDMVWGGSPLFCSFDREELRRIAADITLSNYTSGPGIPEDVVFSWVEKFNLESSEYVATDSVYLGDDDSSFIPDDPVNFSKDPSYSFFWGKESNRNLDLLVYNIAPERMIKILIHSNGGSLIIETSKNFEPIPTTIPSSSVEKIIVISDESIVDYTSEYKETIVSWIRPCDFSEDGKKSYRPIEWE